MLSELVQTSREDVFAVIGGERSYQELRWPTGAGCNSSVGEELLCIDVLLQDAKKV